LDPKRYEVVQRPDGQYVIVPRGKEPLPAVFDNLEAAQRVADRLNAQHAHDDDEQPQP
jgi:hypothetical protein